MKIYDITIEDNYLTIDGTQYPYNSMRVMNEGDYFSIWSIYYQTMFVPKIKYDEFSLNGTPFDSAEDLSNFFSNNFFVDASSGGGGTSITAGSGLRLESGVMKLGYSYDSDSGIYQGNLLIHDDQHQGISMYGKDNGNYLYISRSSYPDQDYSFGTLQLGGTGYFSINTAALNADNPEGNDNATLYVYSNYGNPTVFGNVTKDGYGITYNFNPDGFTLINFDDSSPIFTVDRTGIVFPAVPILVDGKIKAENLPNSVMELQGSWNAALNSPTLVDGVGNAGDVWEVVVAGNVNLGSGVLNLNVGDWVVYGADNIWFKSTNSNEVVTVNGKKGAVTLTQDDVADGTTNKRILQGGNTFGTLMTIGPNDANNIAFQTGGTTRATITSSGISCTLGIQNNSSSSNARITFGATGTVIDSNKANTDDVLTVNNLNTSSTGNMQSWKVSGTNKALIDINGYGRFSRLYAGTSLAAPTMILDVDGGSGVNAPDIMQIKQNGGSFYFGNGTSNTTVFFPTFKGISNSSATGLLVMGQGSNTFSGSAISLRAANALGTGATTGGNALKIQNFNTDLAIVDYQGNLSLGAVAPTHTLTLPSTSTGIASYNTVDQTGNYERVREYWNSNAYNISSEAGGTGTARVIRINGNAMQFNQSATLPGYITSSVNTGSSNATLMSLQGNFTATTSMQQTLLVNPTIAQGSTAGYRGLWITPTETSTGSGNKYLIDAGTGGTGAHSSKFTLDNTGLVNAAQYKVSAMNTNPASATDTGTLGEIRITSTYIYVCTATNTWVRAALTTW